MPAGNKLKITFPSDTEILFTREFDAPPHLVYEASTRPEHVRRWWNCMEGFQMPVCEIDLRVGGKWRYVLLDPKGAEIGFHGEYREIVPNARLVNTEVFDPFPDNETVVTYVFEGRGDRTLFTALQKCPSKEGRDAIVASGMETGAAMAYDRLENVARELAARAA
ncbi:MAG: SRPBCC family protein [Deltaproteobacteria bacterium]|nr:SRPBCC family protein [Deltaproteobacteria bacterium]MCW5803081.1 SRPBCC family protein [Deltaproteobacteria bacterium]